MLRCPELVPTPTPESPHGRRALWWWSLDAATATPVWRGYWLPRRACGRSGWSTASSPDERSGKFQVQSVWASGYDGIVRNVGGRGNWRGRSGPPRALSIGRSEEHTSELQSPCNI